jgi:hypothetical protein
MDLKFIINDYIIIWYLLFQTTDSEELNKIKQKLWTNHKEEYNNIYQDKSTIFEDYKNYIPSDDTIYNVVLETKKYEKIKSNVEKYRKFLMSTWDANKKSINRILRSILRINIVPYDIFIVNRNLNILDNSIDNTKNRGNLVIGKDDNNFINTIFNLLLTILRKEIKVDKETKEPIARSIMELIVLNELPTRLTNKSTYISGRVELNDLKRQIYPFWLMYLGIKKEDLNKYMERDKITFNIDDYKYNKHLSRMDIEEFIDFIYDELKK